jgi:hypothetical protein
VDILWNTQRKSPVRHRATNHARSDRPMQRCLQRNQPATNLASLVMMMLIMTVIHTNPCGARLKCAPEPLPGALRGVMLNNNVTTCPAVGLPTNCSLGAVSLAINSTVMPNSWTVNAGANVDSSGAYRCVALIAGLTSIWIAPI